jgi:hypothetical protein
MDASPKTRLKNTLQPTEQKCKKKIEPRFAGGG